MASIVQRNNHYHVVYSYTDPESGKRKQKWETFKSMADAKRRKAEVEYRQGLGTMVVPKCKTVDDLLQEYVNLYGKTTWSISAYTSNVAMIKHYITPIIGNMKLSEVTTRVLEKYYLQLLKTPAVHRITQKNGSKDIIYVAPATIKKIHNVLRSAFHQAVKWELVEKNPALYATVPKAETKKRDIWDAPTLFHVNEVCEDERLKLSINLAFACCLRIGELLGLTWDCVDISPESIAAEKASIHINKELQRVSKDAMEALENKDVICVFPPMKENNRTALVLKKPKTDASTRTIYLPRTVAEMLADWKRKQDFTKEALGSEYSDFNLVMANSFGMPTEQSRITALFKELIKQNNLPKVVFHSLRHTSVTYKLQLSDGDIKSVQGDSGHAQAQMVTDQYAHILDENRRNNARRFEEAFYSGAGMIPTKPDPTKAAPQAPADAVQTKTAQSDAEMLLKLLQKPELATLLKSLAQSL